MVRSLFPLLALLPFSLGYDTGLTLDDYTVSCLKPMFTHVGDNLADQIDSVNAFGIAYPPHGKTVSLQPNTCHVFSSTSLQSATWICNRGKTKVEFAPDRTLITLDQILLVGPCSKAGMDTELQSGPKVILIEAADPKVLSYITGPGGETVVPIPHQTALKRSKNECRFSFKAPDVNDCIALANYLPTTYLALEHDDIVTLFNGTCALDIESDSDGPTLVNTTELADNITTQLIPCITSGMSGRIWDSQGFEATLRRAIVEGPGCTPLHPCVDPNTEKRTAHEVADSCFRGDVPPEIEDCNALLMTMNESSVATYDFETYTIKSFTTNTCTLYLVNNSNDKMVIDKTELVNNATLRMIPCIVTGLSARMGNLEGVEATIQRTQYVSAL